MRCLSLQRLIRLSAFLLAAMLASVVGGGSPLAKTQAASAQLAFSPSSASVAVGNNVAVNITVANVSNLGGYDVHLQFNPAIVHVASMTDSGFVTGGGNIVVCNTATIDNSAGTATAACVTIAPFGTPVPGVSTVAPRALVNVSFTGVAAGTSSLTLSGSTGSTLEDPNGAPIAVKLGTGSITVAAGVGGVTDLSGVGRAASRTSADARAFPYVPLVLALGVLAAVAAGAGYVLRRRRF